MPIQGCLPEFFSRKGQIFLRLFVKMNLYPESLLFPLAGS